jgi:hypothetical protein
MTAWADLTDELDRWGQAGRTATFWWRDDDAAAATPALETLLRLAQTGPKLALAVIPAQLQPDAIPLIARAHCTVLQHGFTHLNHAPPGEKAGEFPSQRLLTDRLFDLGEGRAVLKAAFGAAFLPAFVPPWNRIGADFVLLLPGQGLMGLSTFNPVPESLPRPSIPGLRWVNCHCDPIAWKQGRVFRGDGFAIEGLVRHLEARRLGKVAEEPTGLLTHHLVHDMAMTEFLTRLFATTQAHPAARWLSPEEVFA